MNAQSEHVWAALARAHNRALNHIEHALKEAGLPPLEWYDVLWELEQAAAEGLRAKDLEPRLLLPQYGLSRLLARIEAAGLLKRLKDPADGRAQLLHITADGRATRLKMWDVYKPAIDGLVGKGLKPVQQERLVRLLGRLAA